MENNTNDDIKIDSFRLYDTPEDGVEKEINGKKYINNFEMYSEDTD